eukprot:scaffold75876_cov21-Prasinocladus_malaysianus.AAC.1
MKARVYYIYINFILKLLAIRSRLPTSLLQIIIRYDPLTSMIDTTELLLRLSAACALIGCCRAGECWRPRRSRR